MNTNRQSHSAILLFAALAINVVILGAFIAYWGTIMYVAWHFIVKFW